MAAQALVRPSYAAPVDTYAVNVMGTVHLLEAVREASGVRAVVVVTSDKCYENREWVWGYRESDPMGGHDPYSNSKGCAELVTAAYRRSFFDAEKTLVGIGSARAGNVIGGGDWAVDRLVPDIVSAFAAGRPAEIRHPAAVRPWQHVLEPLAGYLTLAEHLSADPRGFGEGWNFGPSENDARPVSWIATRLAELWEPGGKWQASPGQQLHEAHTLTLDCSKARARLGWAPRLDLGTALEWVAEWYRCFHAGKDVASLTTQQIARYQARAIA
jgi:CDP-glucose 4,6-dehydratase